MKVLFIDSTHPILMDKLEAEGFDCEYRPDITEEDVYEKAHLYDVFVIRSKFKIKRDLLEKATRLKAIGRVGAGLENIDTEFAEKRGIVCINVPEGNRDALGEQTVGMLLMLFNNLYRAQTQVKNGQWIREGNRGIELKGKTVGIIGYGNMGGAFAQRLAGFEVEVLAYDKYKIAYGNPFAKEATLEDIFNDADVLSLHVPLTDETRFMIDSAFLERFRKDIFVVNTSRGKVVKTSDLVAGLKTGKVRGAALDVLEYEKTSFENLHKDKLPSEFEYLINADNVVLSPHIAGWTHESNVKLAVFTAEKIIQAVLHKKP